jgi:hypothetical protein
MIRYGTQICKRCVSFGIELSVEERKLVIRTISNTGKLPHVLSRNIDAPVARCSNCLGMGWLFVANYPKIQLPTYTIKRW